MRRRNADEGLRELERATVEGDPAAAQRLRAAFARAPREELYHEVFVALFRGGFLVHEHVVALAILGDDDARRIAWEPKGPETLTEGASVTTERLQGGAWIEGRLRTADASQSVHLKFENGLSSLGPFFCVLSALAVVEAVFFAKWNHERAALRVRAKRVFKKTRAWLAGEERGRAERLIRERLEREARERLPFEELEPSAFEYMASFFYRGAVEFPASWSGNMVRALAEAVFAADRDPSGTTEVGREADRYASLAIAHADELVLVADVSLWPGGDPEELQLAESLTEGRLSAVLLEVLTPWVIAGSPSEWVMPTVEPIE